MNIRNYIFLTTIVTVLSSCVDDTQSTKYSVTTYITSFDSAHVPKENLGKKYKYSYEKYNSDSNLIYQELYTNEYQSDDNWGKFYKKTKFFYNGKQKIKAEIEGGTPYEKGDGFRDRFKETDTYEYTGGQLTKWLIDGKLHQEYKYNSQKEMIGKRLYLSSDSSDFVNVRNTYFNGLKIKTEYFPVDTMYTSVDTFIYKNNKLVEEDSYTSKGRQTEHKVIVRDDKGRAVEEKWKKPILDWRQNLNGQWINAEFNQENKYFYDNKGRLLRTEYYRADEYYHSYKLITIYEFRYT